MFLFFDTETTGLPQRWNAPVTNVDNWPRLVQLAWIMCDDKGNIIEERSDIIKPEGFSIPVESFPCTRDYHDKSPGGRERFIINLRAVFG